MRGRWWVVVMVALLAISAQPVAAQNASAVASEHTTFGTGSQGEPAPTQLTNLFVTGSGSDASLSLVKGGTTSLPDTSPGQSTVNYRAGVKIVPSWSITSITVNLDTDSGATNLYITDTGGTVLAQSSVSSGNATFNYNLDAGTAYYVVADAGGSSYTPSLSSSASYPYSSEALSVEAGVYSRTTESSSNLYNIKSITADVNRSTAQYISAVHDAEAVDTGFTNLSLTNMSATVTWQEDGDGDGVWTNVTSTTASSTTNVTQDLSGTASDRWRLRVDINKTGSNPVAEIHDEGLLFNASDPVADMARAEPTGKTTSSPVNISIPVSDTDFSLAQGDSVSVAIQTRPSGGSFSTISTQTIASNQTVSANFSPSIGGEYEYRAVLTDSYGHSVTSTTNTFSTPAILTIYRETYDTRVITGVNVTVRFYTQGDNTAGTVITRTTTNGTVDMSGLPVDQPIVAVANASGYESRRVFIRSLYQQQRIYLLNTSVDSVETIFQQRDYTGEFPPDATVLEIQRSINGSFQTISGDYFGAAAEYPAVLEVGTRYRLRLYNPVTGATRLLGTYQPIAAQTQTLTVSPTRGLSDRGALPTAVIRPQTRRIPAVNNTELSVALPNSDNTTVDSWRVIVERNGTTIANTTYPGSTRESTLTADLGSAGGTQVTVTVKATLGDGQTITAGVAALQVYHSPANQLSLLTLITDFVGLAAPGTAGALTSFLATVTTIFVMAGLSTQLPVSGETTALAGVLTLVGFAVIGWVGYGVVFVSGAAVVAFAALRRGL